MAMKSAPNARKPAKKHHAITREKRDKMMAALRAGALYRDAALAAGIGWSTWMNWTRDVREGTCTSEEVIDLVTRARATYARTNVDLHTVISKAAAKDWKAAAWQLQHRQGDPKARHDAKRAQWEAEWSKARAEEAGKGVQTPVVVVELPESLLKPREDT